MLSAEEVLAGTGHPWAASSIRLATALPISCEFIEIFVGGTAAFNRSRSASILSAGGTDWRGMVEVCQRKLALPQRVISLLCTSYRPVTAA